MPMSEPYTMKDAILDATIELVAMKGYENVSMREIAKEVGIKVSSIYNHYESKEELLNCIYNFYVSYYTKPINEEQIKEIIRNSPTAAIIKSFNESGLFTPDQYYKRMVLTTKIIFMRCYNDERANSIFLNIIIKMREDYLESMLAYGIEIGRFKKFDSKAFAKSMVGIYTYMGIKSFCSPEYTVSTPEEEEDYERLFIDLLPMNDKTE